MNWKDDIEALLKRGRQLHQEGDDAMFIDDDDLPALRAKLRARAAHGPLAISDLRAVLNAMEEARNREVQAYVLRRTGCTMRCENIQLYRVENAAGRSVRVAAASADCARLLAHIDGHVQEEKNAKVFRYKDEYVADLRRSGSAIGRVLRDGQPGVLREIGRNIVIERTEQVFTPLTVVDAGG